MEVLRTKNLAAYNMMSVSNVHALKPFFTRIPGRLLFVDVHLPHGLKQLPSLAYTPIERSLQFFKKAANVKDTAAVNMECIRLRCEPWSEHHLPRYALDTGARPNGVDDVVGSGEACKFEDVIHGIFCVGQDNVMGGLHAFKSAERGTIMRDIRPGELFIYKPSAVQHACGTPYYVGPEPNMDGYVDFVIFHGCQQNNKKI